MRRVMDIVEHRLFRLENLPSHIYRAEGIVADENGDIEHVKIRRVAFKMDGDWIGTEADNVEQCNPYALVRPLSDDLPTEDLP